MRPIQLPLMERMMNISKKYNIPVEKIIEIESTMWDFVRTEISRGEHNEVDTFENIYLRYLGTFHVRRGMVEHMKEKQSGK